MSILYYVVAIAVLAVVLKIIALPFKIAMRFIINSIVGGIVLYILAFFGIGITINTAMIILTGLFGIPGLIIAIIFTFLI